MYMEFMKRTEYPTPLAHPFQRRILNKQIRAKVKDFPRTLSTSLGPKGIYKQIKKKMYTS